MWRRGAAVPAPGAKDDSPERACGVLATPPVGALVGVGLARVAQEEVVSREREERPLRQSRQKGCKDTQGAIEISANAFCCFLKVVKIWQKAKKAFPAERPRPHGGKAMARCGDVRAPLAAAAAGGGRGAIANATAAAMRLRARQRGAPAPRAAAAPKWPSVHMWPLPGTADREALPRQLYSGDSRRMGNLTQPRRAVRLPAGDAGRAHRPRGPHRLLGRHCERASSVAMLWHARSVDGARPWISSSAARTPLGR